MAHVKAASRHWLVLGVCVLLHTVSHSQPIFECLDYSPYREGQYPGSPSVASFEQIVEDVSLLKAYTAEIRSYGLEDHLDLLPRICDSLGMGLHYGVWLVAGNQVVNDVAVDKLVSILRQGHPSIRSVVIGTESIYRGEITVAQLIEYIKQVKAVTSAPVSAGETFYQYLALPALAEAVDFILYHCYPFWEGISLQEAPQYILDRYNQLKTKYPGKELVLGETGWPSGGAPYKGNVPSDDNQFTFFSNYLRLAQENGLRYMLFEAFDEPWKTTEEADFASHWGFFDKDRNPKPVLNRLEGFLPTATTQSPRRDYPPSSIHGEANTLQLPIYNVIGRLVGYHMGERLSAEKAGSGIYLLYNGRQTLVK
jgi:exo-beta-1,3-glucanase (GH17 family)